MSEQFQIEEQKRNEKYQLEELKRKDAEEIERQRISRAKIGEKIPFETYTNEYFPKIGNEIEIEYKYKKEDPETYTGIVSSVTHGSFQMLNYNNGGLVDVKSILKMRMPGTITILKEKPDYSNDCLKSFRHNALDFVKADFSQFKIMSILTNPFAVPGNPAYDVFCKFMEEYPLIIAYHGTSRTAATEILKSRVETAAMAYYGEGAYFTTNPMLAFDYGTDRRQTGYEKHAKIRDIIVCALSLNPYSYDFSDERRPIDEIVNKYTVSNIPLFHLRVRLRKSQRFTLTLPENHERFLLDPLNQKTKVLVNHSTKKFPRPSSSR